MNKNDKIILEEKISELEYKLEELSNVVLEQWKIINRQGTSLKTLATSFLKFEEEHSSNRPITKPPHF